MAELLRAGVAATDPGQAEAARTLGFSGREAFRLITLPQMLRIAKPVYQSMIVNLIQWTSVVGYVTITDPFAQAEDGLGITILKHVGRDLTHTYENGVNTVSVRV